MNLVSIFLSITFALKVWCNTHKDVHEFIKLKYGVTQLRKTWSLFNIQKKLEKAKLDLEFLVHCKAFNIVPKFIRFKLHRKALHSAAFYKSWQQKLLCKEINLKKRSITSLQCDFDNQLNTAIHGVSNFDSILIQRYIRNKISCFIRKIKETHDKKLIDLGISASLEPCNPDNVIFNHSNVNLSPRLRQLLAYGLDFGLPIHKINPIQYFLAIEK